MKKRNLSILFVVVLTLLLFTLTYNVGARAKQNNGEQFAFLPIMKQTGFIERVSIFLGNGQANNASRKPAVSGNGRFIAFHSQADNLVSNDTNGYSDIFIHDRDTSETTRVSVSSTGEEANNASWFPTISGDGRYVAFESVASNLVTNDTGGNDIFVHDRDTGQTSLASLSTDGEQFTVSRNPALSEDGSIVTFSSYGQGGYFSQIYARNLVTGQTQMLSVSPDGEAGANHSGSSVVSADGRYVAFTSLAPNLVANDANGFVSDVFLYDFVTDELKMISMGYDGSATNGNAQGLAISADGRFVAYGSSASNVVINDTNNVEDIFVYERETEQTIRASVSSTGRHVYANAYLPFISSDGRYVLFTTYADNLIDDDTNAEADVYMRDMLLGKTYRVSLSFSGEEGNGASFDPVMSTNLRFVGFVSSATNMILNDTNGVGDVFLLDLAYFDLDS